ncbi:MAG: DNA polymerase III subunit beta [Sedimenticola sp.]|nr:MAG: DNA polymerase III subunit beta [Sedimenticola sp.]
MINQNELSRVLEADPSLQIVILFGSMANGQIRTDSDIDIAVAANKPLDAGAKLALIDSIGERIGRPVDLVDLRNAGEPLLGQILRKGKKLLVRDRRLLEALISRHLVDTEDFLPYRHLILEQRRREWIGK